MTPAQMIAPHGEKFRLVNGWISCNYDERAFRMTCRRIDMLGDALSKALNSAIKQDANDVQYVLGLFISGQTEAAVDAYNRCETAVRDYFPQWVSELADCARNPRYWKYEDSLYGTEA